MQLRATGLLLTILGMHPSQLQSVLTRKLDVYARATSNEGLLSVRAFWDAHCSSVLLAPGASCPRGLSPADTLTLLSRLCSGLRPWQAWELWDTLDVCGCGLLGCSEFTLLVVLLSAALAQQQLRAVHAFGAAISRVFTGPHVASSCAGLSQCCTLLGLARNHLHEALRQLHLPVDGVSSIVYEQAAKHSSGQWCAAATANDTGSSRPDAHRAAVYAPLPAAAAAGGGGGSQLGCSCSAHSCAGHASLPCHDRWACGAAAHRSFVAQQQLLHNNSSSSSGRCAIMQIAAAAAQAHTTGRMSIQDVHLVLFLTTQLHNSRLWWQRQHPLSSSMPGAGLAVDHAVVSGGGGRCCCSCAVM